MEGCGKAGGGGGGEEGGGGVETWMGGVGGEYTGGRGKVGVVSVGWSGGFIRGVLKESAKMGMRKEEEEEGGDGDDDDDGW